MSVENEDLVVAHVDRWVNVICGRLQARLGHQVAHVDVVGRVGASVGLDDVETLGAVIRSCEQQTSRDCVTIITYTYVLYSPTER